MTMQSHGSAYTTFSGIATSSNIHLSHSKECKAVEIEIISKDKVKPASPEPVRLRTHRLSIFDQLMPEKYSNLVFFFSSNNQCTKMDDVISERKQQLKQSLSKALVPFYPLAGKINANLEIECNDHRVYYVEARAKIQLLDFLCKPEDELINRLFSVDPNSVDMLSKKYVLMVQVSIFDYGGIAIGLNATDTIADTFSMSTFLKAWAARTRESAEQINPSFIRLNLSRGRNQKHCLRDLSRTYIDSRDERSN